MTQRLQEFLSLSRGRVANLCQSSPAKWTKMLVRVRPDEEGARNWHSLSGLARPARNLLALPLS